MHFLPMENEFKKEITKIIKAEPFFDSKNITDEELIFLNLYMIYDKDKFVGFFGLETRESFLNVCYLYIFPSYRKKGYATKTLEEIVNQYKDYYAYIYLFAKTNNTEALKIYKHYSFLANDCATLIKGENFDSLKDFVKIDDDNYEVILYHDFSKTNTYENYLKDKIFLEEQAKKLK